jgi:hypothetical protein
VTGGDVLQSTSKPVFEGAGGELGRGDAGMV